MPFRIDYTKTQPAIYKSMSAVVRAVHDSGLDDSLIELVNIRASQINSCAYCLSLHIPDALEAGVTQEQIDLMSAWQETGDLFSAREQAVLGWTEAVTRMQDATHDDDAWEAVTAVFSDDEAMALTWAVATINTWNRIAVPMRRPIRRANVANAS